MIIIIIIKVISDSASFTFGNVTKKQTNMT